MRELISRLRAAVTPQAVLLLCALMLAVFLLSSEDTQASPLEKRVSQTLSAMEGAGKVSVTIRTKEIVSSSGGFGTQAAQSVPCGAVAVAQGADDPLVEIRLREALCALLGLPAASVSIVTGGK